jgi:hypothetical protein
MKLTNEVNAALKQFADRLPSTYKPAGAPQLGSELMAERPGIRTPKGEALDPNKTYFVKAKGTATNHLRRLRKAYEAGGMDAVVAYLQPYEAFLGTPSEPAAAPLPQRSAEGFPNGRAELEAAA